MEFSNNETNQSDSSRESLDETLDIQAETFELPTVKSDTGPAKRAIHM